MSDVWAGRLLRNPRGSHRAAFLELFFDLVFVFALTQVAQGLITEVTAAEPERDVLRGAAETLFFFLVLWLIWMLAAWVTSLYDPEQTLVQVLVIVVMFGTLVLAITMPDASGHRAVVFAGAYVTIQLGRPLALTLALRDHPRRKVTTRITIWSAVAALPWLVGAVVSQPVRLVLWAGALGIEYVGFAAGWPIPWLGASRVNQWVISGEHLVERYQQVFLIALGEAVLVIGLTASTRQLTPGEVASFTTAFAVTVLLWRIYFHRAGRMLPEAIRDARSPARLGESATYTHLVTVAAVMTTAVGFELVIAHPTDRSELPLVVIMLGGPALFLLARSWAEYEVFARLPVPHLVGTLVLTAMIPIASVLPQLAVLVTAAVVLVLIALTDTLRTRGRPAEQPSSPL
ncbi:low temperature requirement protein A [Micromonospora acroterricola]|uniref:Low temperature requirement protein A n=1 Tax=Micromonospora acroterricola TaxID=2202421 RepID=A0A317DBP5_9ACTN|nr:low temperature requirement protein A [Micromonospora acroterricola]PWR10173.1 low temperature requirement protein A [Micromonospora acroterricola]